MKKVYFIFFIIPLILQSCKQDYDVTPTPTPHNLSDANTYSPQVAIDWINTYRQVIASQSLNPPRTSRLFAYAGIGMYECLVEGIKNNKSLQGQLNGFALNSIQTNTDSLAYHIVVNELMYRLLLCDTLVPSLNTASRNYADNLYNQFLSSVASSVADSIVQKSKARGRLVADAIKQYAAADHFQTVRNLSYTLPPRDAAHPWYWVPTDMAHLNPAEPYWSQIRPFVMDSAAQFLIPQSTPYNEDTSSAFGHLALEVYNTVNARTNEQNDIVLWWRDGTGAQTPAGHWMAILQYIIHQKNYKLGKAAELYALLGITEADAFISCWTSKYRYNLLRPETYIRDFISSSWTTGQNTDITPTFPEYPSGHSVASGAAATVLTNALGMVAFTDSCNTWLGYMPRSFVSFSDAAQEAAISRIYGGIHYMEAINNGVTQGNQIGNYISSKIAFR